MIHPPTSIIVAAYQSNKTIKRSIQSFVDATTDDDEIIVVDSSPDPSAEDLITDISPRVRYIRSTQRLNPHQARTLGVKASNHCWLLFTDPDIYAPPDWLHQLFRVLTDSDAIAVTGSLRSYTQDWFSLGIHLVKFTYWLPSGVPRLIDFGLSANLLIHRDAFLDVGGFSEAFMAGDTWLCLALNHQGKELVFAPDAAVDHHHTQSWSNFLSERFHRAYDEQLMIDVFHNGRPVWYHLVRCLVDVLPVRLVKILLTTGYRSWASGQFLSLLVAFPVVLSGITAWLWGDAKAHWQLVFGGSERARRV